MTESLTNAYFAITLDVCGLGNGRGVSEKMRNDGFGETPWTDFVFDAAYWCDACSRDTPFLMKKHVSRAGFAEMAGKLSSDTLFWAEKSVSRQGRGLPSSKWRFYGWEPFRMDLMVTKGDES